MHEKGNHAVELDKKVAAVCGLYCEACTLFIATKEDPARLKGLAARFQVSEEEVKCYGCRSTKRGPYCEKCKMFSCAAERGIDFCVECKEYPCSDLKQFQSERPHRIELWDDLEQIKAMGYEYWLNNIRTNYACPQCQTINSAYDLKCRKCGEPTGAFIGRLLQHIPLPNAILVRSYGIYSPSKRDDLSLCREILGQGPVKEPEFLDWQCCFKQSDDHPERCPVCGKRLILTELLPPLRIRHRSGDPPPIEGYRKAA